MMMMMESIKHSHYDRVQILLLLLLSASHNQPNSLLQLNARLRLLLPVFVSGAHVLLSTLWYQCASAVAAAASLRLVLLIVRLLMYVCMSCTTTMSAE